MHGDEIVDLDCFVAVAKKAQSCGSVFLQAVDFDPDQDPILLDGVT
jgi:hypothetical protein